MKIGDRVKVIKNYAEEYVEEHDYVGEEGEITILNQPDYFDPHLSVHININGEDVMFAPEELEVLL